MFPRDLQDSSVAGLIFKILDTAFVSSKGLMVIVGIGLFVSSLRFVYPVSSDVSVHSVS